MLRTTSIIAFVMLLCIPLHAQDGAGFSWDRRRLSDNNPRVAIELDRGEWIYGRIVAATAEKLIVWQDEGVFRADEINAKLLGIPHEQVNKILLPIPGKSETGLYWIAGVAAVALDPSLTEEWSAVRLIVSALSVGAVAGMVSSTSGLSSKSTAELHYRAGYRAEFGEHPLFQVMNFEQTLPPEAMRQLGLGSTEDLLSVEDPVFPYVLTRDSTESVPQSGLHMAFDQVLIRTDSYVGGHTLLSLEYDWWPALLQHGSLGIGGAVSAGVGYNGTLTLESLAAARMGSFHLAGGLRFMHFPFPLVDEESTFRESQFSTHYTTTSELQENRPADIRGDLYSSFGIGFRMQRVQLRVQLLRQIAPSVHIESHRSGNQYPPTDPYGSITDGIRLTAISISAGIIF